MPELVRLDESSLARIEAFFAEVAGAPVRIGPVWLATGRLGGLLAGVARASGITLDRVICLDRDVAARLRGGIPALDALGALLVHECVHVWQYQRDGRVLFLANYLLSYFNSLYALGSLATRCRDRAYLAIPAEAEARELERRWRDR